MKPIPLVKVGLTSPAVRKKVDAVLKKALDQSAFIGGPEMDGFAKEFGAYCGGVFCAPVANGTDALVLALRALGVQAGDEVITVPFTFIATTEAISWIGASVRFVDIDPKTYNLDPARLDEAIGPKTRAVIPVHLFGQPADMDPIVAIARKKGLKVLEDAAQAHGAEYKGRRVGSLGDAASFSFYPTKNLGAIGDAGAVTSASADVAARVTQLANHGRSAQYHHAVEGTNSRMDAFQAAVLRIKLSGLEAANKRRRAIAAQYDKALKGHPLIEAPYTAPEAKPVHHLYCVQSPRRDELMTYLKGQGIACGVYYPLPLHLQPAYAHLHLRKGAFPHSERASERILALPMFPEMTAAEVARVCKALKSFGAS